MCKGGRLITARLASWADGNHSCVIVSLVCLLADDNRSLGLLGGCS